MNDYSPPMKGLASDAEVLAAIQHVVDEIGSQKLAAEKLRVDPKVLSDILYGRRIIPMGLAFRVGFLPAWCYVGKKTSRGDVMSPSAVPRHEARERRE